MSLTNKIFLALILGLTLGSISNVFQFYNSSILVDIVDVPGSLFIALLKMLVVPVVFFSLVSGVSNLSNLSALGRIGGKSFFLYLLTTSIAITLALFISSIINPGSNANFETTENFVIQEGPSLKEVILGIVPSNPFKAFSDANMLQVIFFAILFGITVNILKAKAEKIRNMCNLLNDFFLKMIEVIMVFAPVGVFFLIYKTFLTQGYNAIFDLGAYFISVIIVLIFHFFITYGGLLIFLTRINIIKFYSKMKNTILFAFSTSSSAATIPITLKTVEEKLGVDKSVASFTVPLGATINMDGTAIMQGVATVFIANAYNIELVLVDYLSVVLIATLASIGTAGVPGVGLIMLTMVLNQVGLPTEGIALIIGIDRILDMTRTAVNVTGDATISCLVGKSESKLNYRNINA